jgi:hypothetical protein
LYTFLCPDPRAPRGGAQFSPLARGGGIDRWEEEVVERQRQALKSE